MKMNKTYMVIISIVTALFAAVVYTYALANASTVTLMGEQSASPSELLVNTGFEQQLLNWSTSSGSATYTADTSNLHSGSYSAKGIETDPGSLGRLYQDVTSKVTPNQWYKISGWIKTQDVTGAAVIGLDYVTGTGWTPAGGFVREIGYVSGTSGWEYYESDIFKLPPMPENASALWFLFDLNGGAGIAYWDDVSLVNVPFNGLTIHVENANGQPASEAYISRCVI